MSYFSADLNKVFLNKIGADPLIRQNRGESWP